MAITLNGNGVISGITDYDSGDVGRILQVKSATKTDVDTYNQMTMTNITGLTVNITPSSTNSKILLIAYVNLAADTAVPFWQFARNGTGIALGTSSGYQHNTTGFLYNATTTSGYALTAIGANHLDSPSTTSQITYSCQWKSSSANTTVYINRRPNDNYVNVVSCLTAMEVG